MQKGKIVIAGGGVLGSQIAFQAAYCGYDTTIWLRSEGSIGRTQPKLKQVFDSYIEAIEQMKRIKALGEGASMHDWALGIADFDTFDADSCVKKAESARDSLKLELDLAKALEGAEVIIEATAEELTQKIAFFKMAAPHIGPNTILATNTSTLMPSKMAKYTGCPDRFLSLHFANNIWKQNITEVMGHKGTSQASFDAVMAFADSIRMLPLPVRKEKAGYLLNSMLVPLLFSAGDLLVNGISDHESIDKAWKRGTGAPYGPFEILDIVGLATAYHIVSRYAKLPGFLTPYNFKGQAKLFKKYIDEGKLGKNAGEGFYKYPTK